MFHLFKRASASVPSASAGKVRFFIDSDSRPKIIDETGTLIDLKSEQALEAAQAVRDDLQPQIDTINGQLPDFAMQAYLDAELATKATQTELDEVKALAETNQLNVSTKAEQTDLDSLGETVTAQTQTLLTKADISTLTTLAQLVDTKADQSYVIGEISRITGNAPAALDTLSEIAEQLGNDQSQINNLLNQIGNRVRFDAAQALTAPQQDQVLSNINAEKAGTASALVAAITPASIGAATAAQGDKANTALQSGDVAPVALSGSFSDLVNKSSLFNLIYSAYALGSNTVIVATDTLGQMLGKLQAQISANKIDIDSKEPAITAGTTSQYLRGDKAWRDFATDVRATLLTGLSTATATVIVATDSVLSALGKLQAQVTANSTAIAAKVDVVQLTKAQYDALTTAEKNSTTKLYVIVG